MAQRWANETPNMKRLPTRKKQTHARRTALLTQMKKG